MQIKIPDIRESFSKAVQTFQDRTEKLTKNLDIGTHELEINSFYHNFITKGIKNSLKSENRASSITSLYNFGFASLQDKFLEDIDLENESNPIWDIFNLQRKLIDEEAIESRSIQEKLKSFQST